jgi:hypothetical protein
MIVIYKALEIIHYCIYQPHATLHAVSTSDL